MKRNLKHRRSLGGERPFTHPAAVVIVVDADHLKQTGIGSQTDAVTLMKPHEGSVARLKAALPLQN